MMGTALMENNCNEWKRMVSYCDRWMCVARRASLVVHRVSCISRSHRLKIDFQDENFNNFC